MDALPGGAFVTMEDVGGARVITRESDLSVRWSSPLSYQPSAMLGSADGSVWLTTETFAGHYDASGATTAGLPLPFPPTAFSLLADGGAVAAGLTDIARLVPGADPAVHTLLAEVAHQPGGGD